ncbi:DMT family transporter [Leifsonia sp. A12D58]|uniref:DMT family transporter n=1 Tax=Leifsonia sp. A12D58 TaxID=3397674 RepID=UPI0039DF82D5
MRQNNRGVVPILIASLLWGTTGTAAHFLPDDVSPLAIGAATMAIGGGLLFLLSAQGSMRAMADKSVRGWVIAGVGGIFVYPLAFYSSMNLAGVAIGTVISLGSAPLFAAAIEYLVDRGHISARWALCTGIAVMGTVLLVIGRPADTGASASDTPLGVLLGLLAGLSYALYTDASRRVLSAGHSSNATMGALFGLGALCLVPVLLFTGAPLLQSASSIGITAYLALGPMFLAYILFGTGLRTVTSSTATTITLVEPLVATILAIVIVGERLDPLGWLGLAMIMIGVVILVGWPTKKPR